MEEKGEINKLEKHFPVPPNPSCTYYLSWVFMAVMGSTRYIAHAYKCLGLCAENAGGKWIFFFFWLGWTLKHTIGWNYCLLPVSFLPVLLWRSAPYFHILFPFIPAIRKCPESLGACQVNIELESYLLNASTQRGNQELEQARKQQTINAH